MYNVRGYERRSSEMHAESKQNRPQKGVATGSGAERGSGCGGLMGAAWPWRLATGRPLAAPPQSRKARPQTGVSGRASSGEFQDGDHFGSPPASDSSSPRNHR